MIDERVEEEQYGACTAQTSRSVCVKSAASVAAHITRDERLELLSCVRVCGQVCVCAVHWYCVCVVYIRPAPNKKWRKYWKLLPVHFSVSESSNRLGQIDGIIFLV